jgi:integrase
MATVFKYRGGYRAEARDASGRYLTKQFCLGEHAQAKQWAADNEADKTSEHAPELGGPTQATLAAALARYAELYTIKKDGAVQELNRIGHYLQAAGLSLLRLGTDEAGQAALIECPPQDIDKRVSKAWQAHLLARRESSARTYACIAKLACMRVAKIGRPDIDAFVATMTLDGLSKSTIQKEISLLKHLFNNAISGWYWTHFTNPCNGVKLGASEHRFVRLSREQFTRLYAALDGCDNPYFWPLVDTAIYLTARQKSLLALRWSDIDLESRNAVLRKTKTGTVIVPLSRRVAELLGKLPHHPSGFVFPMTKNAVKCAWDGVRIKAGLAGDKQTGEKALQFRDLRHLGGTYYGRLVRDAHVLRQILGHKTIYMAQVYINLSNDDLVADLDHAEDTRGLDLPPLPATGPRLVGERTSRKAQRVIDAIRLKYGKSTPTPDAQAAAKAASGGASNVVQLFAKTPSTPHEADPAGAPKAGANGGCK